MKPSRDIFLYSDYRTFLADYYKERKRMVPGFTFSIMAEQAGFSSASFQKLVMDGKKNLSEISIQKIGKALKLTAKAQEYFAALVLFNQAKTFDEKLARMKTLDRCRRRNCPEQLLPREYGYLKEWYHAVIREMVELPDFVEDPSHIADKLVFHVKPDQVAGSISYLLAAGFLVREGGRLVKTNKTLASGSIDTEEARAVALNYHLTMIDLAREAAKTLPRAERSVANTTLSISAATYQAALKRIEQMRLELLELAASDNRSDQVFQLNINLFPMTRKKAS